MSADSDSKCPFCEQDPCACEGVLTRLNAANERIALTAELAEAQYRLNDADGALEDAGTPVRDERFDQAIQRLHAERDAERAAHERTKAELEHAMKDVQAFAEMQRRAGEGLQRVARERDAAKAELKEARAVIAEAAEASKRQREAALEFQRRELAAQAEAAAMRNAVCAAIADGLCLDPLSVVRTLTDALAKNSAGRDLAARVALLEDFAREFLETEPQRRSSPSLTVAAQAALDAVNTKGDEK